MQQVACDAGIPEQILAMLRLEHQLPTQSIDRLALLVHHVVVLEDVLPSFKVAGLDSLLSAFDLFRDRAGFDGDALFHT